MNDTSEFLFGYKEFKEIILNIERELDVEEQYKISSLWTKPESVQPITEEKLKEIIFKSNINPFAISFSRIFNSLPHWVMYAEQGKGVCIKFKERFFELIPSSQSIDEIIVNSKWNRSDGLDVTDISYDFIDEQDSSLRVFKEYYIDYLTKYNGQNRSETEIQKKKLWLLTFFAVQTASYVKQKCFEFEHETRLLMDSLRTQAKVQFRTNGQGRLIPYIKVKIPVDYITEIMIGPCADYDSAKYSLDLLLKSKGLIIPITSSKLPYRS